MIPLQNPVEEQESRLTFLWTILVSWAENWKRKTFENGQNAERVIAHKKTVLAWWVKMTLFPTFLLSLQPKGLKVKLEH